MTSITRSPIAWLLFAACALAATLLTIHLFPHAFAIVQLDVSMDRVQALESAQQLSQTLNLGPTDAQQAASFVTDDIVKTFVELEGGGITALTNLINQNLYQPYTWQIRHFKPYNAHELLIKYTPNGKPYGFIEAIPENTPGTSVSATQAQHIAELFARDQWHISLDQFTLVEPSKEIRPNGRIDHSFVYQRTDATVGEGFYRLRIVVTGDKVTELNHFVQVPDNFLRRYQHMRTANDAISWVAQLIILFLYIFGGIVGLVVLMRRGWVLWKLPLWCGLLLAFLQLLVRINSLPLLWMAYKTSLSPVNFLLYFGTAWAYQFVYTVLFYAIIFAAAESLTRKAFANQPQFWQLWTPLAGNSYQVLGRTLLGYLSVPFFMLFVVAFYIMVNSYLCWWIPSQAFFEPDILATYLPWLSSLSQALSAGFMEECLFRAIPLASAMLLGRRYGYTAVWVTGAFVFQAIIFSAAHANYPMQPAYARVVELIIPSFGFGGLYLAYGLLPGIIAHVVYDIAWMALPIFISKSPQAFNNQIMVILLGSLPLLVLLYYRIKHSSWTQLPHSLYNNLWRPSVSIAQAHQYPAPIPLRIKQSTIYLFWLLAIGGLVTWALSTQLQSDAPAITIDRTMAQQIAQEQLIKNNIPLAQEPWKTLTKLSDDGHTDMQHSFIWQAGNPTLYHSLLNSYLTPPHWIVRFAHFEGDLTRRAEEYRVHIDGKGTILRTQHILPEPDSGQNLSEINARLIAHTALQEIYAIDPTQLTEIAASAQKKPARTDWKFTFSDARDYPLQHGQQRIVIEIAGDAVVNYKKFIFVPEEWQRNHENEITIAAIIKQLCGLLIYIMFILAALTALWYFAQSSPLTSTMLFWSFFIFILIFLLKIMNSLPRIMVDFNTCKSFNTQLCMTIGSLIISAFVQSSALAFTLCITRSAYRYYGILNTHIIRISLGASLGCMLAGLIALMHKIVPTVKPLWTSYSYLNSIVPLYDYLSIAVISYISFTLLALLAFGLANHILTRYARHHLYISLFLSTCGLVFAGAFYADNTPLMLTIGVGLSLLLIFSFYSLVRFDHTLIPVATASYTGLSLLQEDLLRSAGQLPLNALLAIVIISILGIGWYVSLNKPLQS